MDSGGMAMDSGRVERMWDMRYAESWWAFSAKERSEMKRREMISEA